MLRRLLSLTFIPALRLALCAVTGNGLHSRGEVPGFQFDANTSKYCDYWLDTTDSNLQCTQVPAQWGISMADLLRWLTVGANCGGLWAEVYVCVSVIDFEAPTTSATPTPSPAKPSNGIVTAKPIQPGMVDNCDAFYFVPKDTGCQAVADANHITLAQFLTWNPSVGSTCGVLWAEAYVCVSIIGFEAPSATPTPKPTTTKPSNRVATPTTTQAGMVGNCVKFHFVADQQTCAVIAALYKISVSDMIK
ncbi:hypothetical protein BKA67DRAFT_538960 [Truncatella angustata]|uniref:LysM domain-containing protein n=1 Tax=Truncatella angustata TaxID=152316 RepID=A0A9P8ZTG7_9PEZI|nr:uncharacterized protein BKA67DRAFT_538960 [Truncatella angustata]KAH6648950.1 hypothetical protein BKA67DRAFT_538960 [Truncatella angustata]KAH8193509.1 hypothetical protein TruAng_012325 [Truncatella angustata]